MGKKKPHGHYCKICDQRKSNESFSGKGHANHICKECAKLSPTEQSESVTINRLMNIPFHRRLTDSELIWLKNRTKDNRETVREMARQAYAARFPFAERNEMKKQLHIRELTFIVIANICDEYGDEISVTRRFLMKKSEPVISMWEMDNPIAPTTIRLEPGRYAKLLKSIVRHYEVFCWEQDYCSSDEDEEYDLDFDLDIFIESSDGVEDESVGENEPPWSVSVIYCNGTQQNISGTNEYLHDKVEELYWDLAGYFDTDEDADDFIYENDQ